MWEQLFGARKWRRAEELTGRVRHDGAVVEFTRGEFAVLTPGFAFRPPTSTNPGRTGVILVETDAEGTCDLPGSRIAVGKAAARRAAEQYGAVW